MESLDEEKLLRHDAVRTNTKLFTFISMPFLDLGFFHLGEKWVCFMCGTEGSKYLWDWRLLDCVLHYSSFPVFLWGQLYILPCWPRLGHVTCLGPWNMNRCFNSHQWFSCALFSLCHELSYIQMGVLHQPGSRSKDDMEQSFSQPVMDSAEVRNQSLLL